MRKVITWIVGIVVVLLLVGFVFAGASSRQAYRTAKGAINQRTQLTQDRIDMAVQMATKAVDLALVQAGNLPIEQAKADLIKQKIEAIGSVLKQAAAARGDAAIARLNASIDLYNQAMQTVDDASKNADSPAAKSALDRIYGILEAAKEQLVQTILNTQK